MLSKRSSADRIGQRGNDRSGIASGWLIVALLAFVIAPPPTGRAEGESAASAAAPELREPPISPEEKSHWAYQPLARPELPNVANADWVRNPIDRFILATLQREGLEPMPLADRATLLRRVTFDLTGLPPTREALRAFLADDSPDAYERIVDRLLGSPAYGERWGQHWLDLARFAETDGFEHDLIRPVAWKYRDWVIEALNEDLPFDAFIEWQIAGDELAPDNERARIATGFLLAGPDMPDINLVDERRDMVLNEMTGTVGSALLGLQMSCAQCHDHKFDPISQADFYRLRAIFETADLFAKHELGRTMGETGKAPAPSRVMVRGDFRRPGPVVRPAFPRIANPFKTNVSLTYASDKNSGRRSALAKWLTRPDHPLAMRVAVNRVWQGHFGRGIVATSSDFGVMGDPPTHPELLDWLATEFPRLGFRAKALHRLIVTSATYMQASRPTGPDGAPEETKAVAARWRQGMDVDPENHWLWRARRRRLEGEAIRDAMLLASGTLSGRRFGPGVMPPLPEEIKVTLLKDHWKTSPDVEDHYRRSVYVFARRNIRYPIFEAFDRPDANASCPVRPQSTIAPQALYLLNSDFSLEMARALAGRALREAAPNDRARVGLLAELALSRPLRAAEATQLLEFLDRQEKLLAGEGRDSAGLAVPTAGASGLVPTRAAAWTDLALAILNLNEFVYVD